MSVRKTAGGSKSVRKDSTYRRRNGQRHDRQRKKKVGTHVVSNDRGEEEVRGGERETAYEGAQQNRECGRVR